MHPWHRFLASLWLLCTWAIFAAARAPPCGPDNVRRFEFTITKEIKAPDGFRREMMVVNGQFPGPHLRINQGDEVEITLHNRMDVNTTIHWHGITQQGTLYNDGVPGVTMTQIDPGRTYVYRWTADIHGAYWWHSHQLGQTEDGLYGPITIYPKEGTPKPWHLISNDSKTIAALEKADDNVQPLLVGDLRHRPSSEIWPIETASGIELPCYDSILLNGKGHVTCLDKEKLHELTNPAVVPLLQEANLTSITPKGCLPPKVLGTIFAPGADTNVSAIPSDIFDVCKNTTHDAAVVTVEKHVLSPSSALEHETWAAFDLTNTMGLHSGSFAFDGLPMWVVAVDGVYIEPKLVDVVTMYNADRFRVLVKLTKPGEYAMRFSSTTLAQILFGVGTLRYVDPLHPVESHTQHHGTPFINEVGVNTTAGVTFFDAATAVNYPSKSVEDVKVDQTFIMKVHPGGRAYEWSLNDTVYNMQLYNMNPPLMFQPQPHLLNNVTFTTKLHTWVDIVFYVTTAGQPPHAMHMHSSKFYVIGQGQGNFTWETVEEAAAEHPELFNLKSPVSRDGQQTPATATGPAWMVIRRYVDNPGAVLLHCHIQSHLSGGMAVVFQDVPEHYPKIPQYYIDFAKSER